MTSDDTLELPSPPRPPAPLGDPDGSLVRAAPAQADPVLCGARRALVRASGLHGVLVAEADGRPLVGRVALDAPPAANVLVTPRTLTREIAAPGGSLREVVVVPERLPGFVIQWTGWSPAEGWPLTVELLAGPAWRHRIEGATLRVADENGEGLALHLAGSPEARWQVVEGGGRRLARTQVRLAGEGSAATLLLDRVEAGQRLPSLPALAALVAHRRRDALEPEEAPGLRLETGVPELDQGVAWARAALRGLYEDGPRGTGIRIVDALPETGGPAPAGSEHTLLAMGALAAGEWSVARAALQAPPVSAVDAEALALWVAWTSVPEPFLEHLETLRRLAESFSQPLRNTLADAAEAAGDEDVAGQLRTPVARPAGTGRRLPTLRSGPGGPGDGGEDDPDGDPRPAFRRNDDGRGFVELRTLLARIMRDGPEPGGLEAAVALDALVRGLLGATPDAGYGRISLAPRLPDHWSRLDVAGMRIGDATVGLAMERDDDVVRWRLRQTAGGAPVTWIFEPRIPLTRVDEVWIDGERAEVDITPVPGGFSVPVQLPAERERVVEVRQSSK